MTVPDGSTIRERRSRSASIQRQTGCRAGVSAGGPSSWLSNFWRSLRASIPGTRTVISSTSSGSRPEAERQRPISLSLQRSLSTADSPPDPDREPTSSRDTPTGFSPSSSSSGPPDSSARSRWSVGGKRNSVTNPSPQACGSEKKTPPTSSQMQTTGAARFSRKSGRVTGSGSNGARGVEPGLSRRDNRTAPPTASTADPVHSVSTVLILRASSPRNFPSTLSMSTSTGSLRPFS